MARRIEYTPCTTEGCPGSREEHYATDSNGCEYLVYSFVCQQCGT